MTPLRRIRDATLAALLLVVPFFFLNANLKDPSAVSGLDTWLITISGPVQYAAAAAARTVSDLLDDYVLLVDVKRDYDRVQADNARMRLQLSTLRYLEMENERLHNLLTLRQRLRGDLIAAQVIAKEVSPFFRVVRLKLDRGERDLIRSGMPVVAAEGLVGQVRRSWSRYCDVMLTVDKSSRVDIVVQRSGARGALVGTGETDRYRARIQHLSRKDNVRVGDVVHTSGLGQRFPPSLLVGRVLRVDRPPSGLYQEVEVEPAVNFAKLEEVLILAGDSRAGDALRESIAGDEE